MGRFLLHKEALMSALLILITVYLINFFPFKYELVKPIKQDFGDFDIYDLHYSGLRDQTTDTNIVLIQIADNRKEIQQQLELLSACQPAVIGIDVDFTSPSGDPSADSALKKQIHDMPEVVTGYRMVLDSPAHRLKVLSNYFDADNSIRSRSGYFNFIGEEISVVRQYAPFYKMDTVTQYALTSRILEKFNPALFQKLKNRNNKTESINFSGNTEHYPAITYEKLVTASSVELEKLIKNKIVLLGIFYLTPPLLMDDIHFTPLNSKITGKSFPDMYGVVIHANVLSMLLKGNYIRDKSVKFTYLFAFLIVFFIVLYQHGMYKKKIHIAHWKLILFQLLSIVLLIYLFFLLFSYFHVRVDLLPVILAIVLSVEFFSPYRRMAEWINKKTAQHPTRKKHRHKK